MSASAKSIGRLGIWSIELRFGDPGQTAEAAAEVEELGYGAIWIPGGRGGDVFGPLGHLMRSTRRTSVATGILNLWMHTPAEVGAWWRSLTAAEQDRVMLGIGVGHAPVIGEAWKEPLRVMSEYLDGLDAEGLPAGRRCLAALGPKMLDLARDRSAGAHPYLITPEHTAEARARLGAAAWLAPEQGVILDADPVSARQKARVHLDTYVRLPNYQRSWKRMGFTDEDVATLSDRLVDGVFAWGTAEQVARRVAAHFDAGADHVCIQVVVGQAGSGELGTLRQAWREIAGALSGAVPVSS